MILLLQPPFVQLNGPYPSLYYLRGFLEHQNHTVQVDDHSIALFHRIFSRQGLERLFKDGAARLSRGPALAPNVDRIARQYLSEQDLWLSQIDRLIAFLQGSDREYAHLLCLCNNLLPSGPRTQTLLESFGGEIPLDQANLLASTLLADLADFITEVLDPTFSLVKYADSLAASIRDFSTIEPALEGYVLKTFYEPLLKKTWDQYPEAPELLGLTIPFPGCLAGALFAAGSAKQQYGNTIPVIAGGGYVTTELRHIKARKFFDYIDFLAFDRGYGAIKSVLDFLGKKPPEASSGGEALPALHHCIFRTGSGSPSGSPDTNLAPYDAVDQRATETVFPDYRGVPFDRYILPVDDTNPMHRLWTEGRWLKAYVAHGCYWHACAFCDVKLDYIRGFQPVPVKALFTHLMEQSRQTGIKGVHLVDEAAPVSSLIQLAILNREAHLPLTFWGNIRFEKAFTPDTAALLASGGLLGVSGGIEVASEAGFKRLGKGIGLKDVVHSCAAFKEAGILTHAYLIFGYWDQDDQELVDAAETLRQLFAAGLIDSAFWHKFVLTRHSRIYRELEQGRHQDLKVIDETSAEPEDFFADNDLRFVGEEGYDRYTQPLDKLLAEWMRGDTGGPVQEAFPFAMPRPNIPPNRVENLLEDYINLKEQNALPPKTHGPRGEGVPPDRTRVLFLGSRPWLIEKSGDQLLQWRWNFTDHTIRITGSGKSVSKGSGNELTLQTASQKPTAETLLRIITDLRTGCGKEFDITWGQIRQLLPEEGGTMLWQFLRGTGLVAITVKP